jgi:flagellar hook assembly protein FlgD
VDIYSVSGHLVRRLSGEAARAEYVRIEWDGRNDAGDRVTPGIYFYRAVAGNMSATRKAILLD